MKCYEEFNAINKDMSYVYTYVSLYLYIYLNPQTVVGVHHLSKSLNDIEPQNPYLEKK